MNEKQLRYFIRIAELKSFTKAAKDLFISQQALSKTIKNLEEEFHTNIFYKTTTGIMLTAFGDLLYTRAKMLITQFDNMESDLKQRASQIQTALTIVFGQNSFIALSLDTIIAFENMHKDMLIEKRFASNLTYIDQVRLGYADLGFGVKPYVLDNMCYIPLVDEEPVVLLSKKNPLLQKENLTLPDLRDETFVFMAGDHSVQQSLIDKCIIAGFTPQRIIESTEAQLLVELVRNNQAIKLLPQYALPAYLNEDVDYIPLRSSTYRIQLGFIYNKTSGLKQSASEFIDFAVSHKPA